MPPDVGWPGPSLFRTPNVTQVAAGDVLDWARLADEQGFDSLWVADHLMLGRGNEIFEGWTTLSAAAP